MQTSEQTPYELPESLGKNLGIQLVSIEEGYVKATMPVDERTSRPCEPKDILNGGASLALAETVAGYGSIPLCEPGQMCTWFRLERMWKQPAHWYTEDVLLMYGMSTLRLPTGN